MAPFVSGLSALLVSAAASASAPPAPRSAAVASALAGIEHGLTSTKYQHRIAVDAAQGHLPLGLLDHGGVDPGADGARRAARDRRRQAAGARLRSRDRARAHRPARPRLAAADRRRDAGARRVFAWLKPEMFKQRANTGHVGFVVGKPWRHPRFDGVWLVRIADATTELHGDDSRPPGGEGGFGTATIAFLVDASGAPLAYGWYGEAQDPATFVPNRDRPRPRVPLEQGAVTAPCTGAALIRQRSSSWFRLTRMNAGDRARGRTSRRG